jgi:hypothetical protein
VSALLDGPALLRLPPWLALALGTLLSVATSRLVRREEP